MGDEQLHVPMHNDLTPFKSVTSRLRARQMKKTLSLYSFNSLEETGQNLLFKYNHYQGAHNTTQHQVTHSIQSKQLQIRCNSLNCAEVSKRAEQKKSARVITPYRDEFMFISTNWTSWMQLSVKTIVTTYNQQQLWLINNNSDHTNLASCSLAFKLTKS